MQIKTANFLTSNPTALGWPASITNVGFSLEYYHTASGSIKSYCDYWYCGSSCGTVNSDGSFPPLCTSQYTSSGVNPAWTTVVNTVAANKTCM